MRRLSTTESTYPTLIFWRVKCNVVQMTPIIKMMFDTWRKKVPWGKQSAKRTR